MTECNLPPEGTVYGGWSLNQERSFLEDLVHKRLTLLAAFVALIFAGAVNAPSPSIVQASILTFGTVVAAALASATMRSHEKLSIILQAIKGNDPSHPVTSVDAVASRRSRFALVGSAVPALCFGAVATATVASWFSCFGFTVEAAFANVGLPLSVLESRP